MNIGQTEDLESIESENTFSITGIINRKSHQQTRKTTKKISCLIASAKFWCARGA